MPANVIIRSRRKELGLTQEQVAEYLGVSAPAVNKWEKGATYPDILLLSPLARVLKIDLNTLLCFEENITQSEITKFSTQIMECIEKDGYEKGFVLAKEKIKEYPNSMELIDHMAVLLEGALLFYGANLQNKERFEEQIFLMYERVATSDDDTLKNKALYMLVSKYIEKENFEKAQKFLDSMPQRSALDKKSLQARLYFREKKFPDAAKLLEQKLMSTLNELQMTIISLIEVELEEGNQQKAVKLSDGLQTMVKSFELWDYSLCVAPLAIAIHNKNTKETLKQLKQMIVEIQKPWNIYESTIYNHIYHSSESDDMIVMESEQKNEDGTKKVYKATKEDAKKRSVNMMEKIIPTLLADLKNNPKYAYLREDKEFKEWMVSLKKDLKEELK